MEPEEALHFHILRRRKEGVEDWIDRSVEKIGAVPTLNEVLLPAMKEVGDKFGAGELILPFVLQSAEVMKRAVAQLEKYLDKIEGYTKGTVVLATVFGDVHDIGKSLVNTILTNNGYTVVDLGKQVPIQTIVDAAQEHEATAIGLSALLVSTSKQMPACIQELHAKGLSYPVLIGGAAINRAFSFRALYPGGKDSEEPYEPGVFYCKDAFEGLSVMDQLIDADAHAALLEKLRTGATAFRAKGEEPVEELNFADDSVRSAARTDVPIPTPPFWGVREIPVDLDEVYPHLDTHVLFKLHWGGQGRQRRGVADAAARRLPPAPGADVARADLSASARAARLLPVLLGRQRHRRARPRGSRDRADALRLPAPAQGRPHLPRRLLPPGASRTGLDQESASSRAGRDRGAGGDGRLGGDRADGQARGRRRVRRAAVRARPRRADRRGPRRVAALARRASMLDIPATQGRRYSWGYPAVPEQSEHLKVEQLLDLAQIGMTITDGYAPDTRAVDARADRPPPPGDLLRHAPGSTAAETAHPTT